MQRSFKSIWKENKSFVLLLTLLFVFRSAVADWSHVPTGSMKPTIYEGDQLLINKMAYDVRLPFTHISLIKLDDPTHGDIIIFDSKALDKRLVKRVLATPGDWVEMKANQLFVNGQKLTYQPLRSSTDFIELTEDIAGNTHTIRIRKNGSIAGNFAPLQIPDEHYLALGDNRDNSADSRFFGLVPRHEIVGRSRQVAFSLDYSNYFLPRTDRFLKDI